MITRQGIAWTFGGLGLGAALAIAALAMLQRFMYGVSPTELGPMTAVFVLLASAGYLACYVPATRATRHDPVTILREP